MREYTVFIVIFCSIVLLSITVPSQAQDIEEQCATQGEDFIDYEGELLLSGRRGMHVIRADSESTLIRLFYDEQWTVETNGIQLAIVENIGFAFSPDNQRIAFLEGDYFCSGHCHRGLFRTLRILTYDTHVRGVVTAVPYEFTYDIGYFDGEHREFTLFWLDNSRLILPEPSVNTSDDPLPSPVAIHVETGEVEPLEWADFLLYALDDVSFSSDRSVIYTYDRDVSSFALVDVATGDVLLELPPLINYEIAWSHNGETLALGGIEDSDKLSLIDLNTFDITVINSSYEPYFFGHNLTTLRWSPDDRYLAYIESTRDAGQASVRHIHIVDTETNIIYNTCLEATTIAWSPNSTQLAYSPYISGLRNPSNLSDAVYIFDLETWQTHLVGSHEGHLLRWLD